MAESDKSEIDVQITSVDGNVTHSFSRSATVGDVHQFAYDNLVQDKTSVPFSSTTVEFKGNGIPDSTALKDLIKKQKEDDKEDKKDKKDKKGKDVDLTLALTWVSQGGAAV